MLTTKTLSEKKIHLAGRIDQAVRNWFIKHPAESEIMAKDLMNEFIASGIFKKDHRNGLPIRTFLRELDAANKLGLLKHCKVVRKTVNRNWYFAR